MNALGIICLLTTSDDADEGLGVDLGGRRIIETQYDISLNNPDTHSLHLV